MWVTAIWWVMPKLTLHLFLLFSFRPVVLLVELFSLLFMMSLFCLNLQRRISLTSNMKRWWWIRVDQHIKAQSNHPLPRSFSSYFYSCSSSCWSSCAGPPPPAPTLHRSPRAPSSPCSSCMEYQCADWASESSPSDKVEREISVYNTCLAIIMNLYA